MKTPISHSREEEAAAYVFGHMERAESEAFAADLKEDAVLREVVRELEEAAASLALGVGQAVPPPALKTRVLDQLKSVPQELVNHRHKESTRQPFRWGLLGWAAAAAIAVWCGMLWDQLNTANENLAASRSSLAVTEKRAASAETQLQASRTSIEKIEKRLASSEKASEGLQQSNAKITEAAGVLKKALESSEQEKQLIIRRSELDKMQIATLKSTIADYKQGVAVVVWDSAKQEGVLKLEKMPPVEPNKNYQLWVVDPSKKAPVNAGVVQVDQKGFARVQFKPVDSIQQADKFALSVEKKVDNPAGVGSNAGPIVLLSP